MNQTHCVLLFGACFVLFLGWLWRYPDGSVSVSEQSQDHAGKRTQQHQELQELEIWLKENSLTFLKPHLDVSGVKSLQDTLNMDVNTLHGLVGKKTGVRLQKALSLLELRLWLKDRGITDLKVLKENKYHSLKDLCSLSSQEFTKMSEQLPSEEKRASFKQALEEKKKISECQSGGSPSADGNSGWSIFRILFYSATTLGFVAMLALFGVILVVLLLAFLIAISLCQLLLHLVTGGRARPVTQRELFTGFISFMGVVFGSVLLNLWRGLQQIVTPGPTNATPRRRRSSASTSATPRAGEFSLNLYERFRGTYIDLDKCVLEWNHDDMAQVGGSSVLTVKMMCKNGTPYEFKPSDCMTCKVMVANKQTTSIPHVVEPTSLIGQHTFKVSFTTKVAGRYILNMKINSKPLGGGEIYRKYIPGVVDSNKTLFLDNTAVLVVTRGVYTTMKIIPKDSFGNQADIQEDLVQIDIKKDCVSGDVIEHEFVAYKNDSNCYELLLKVDEEGHYVGCVKYAGNRLGPPYFTILSLSEEDMKTVEKNVNKKSLNTYYEASIISEKLKKAYCYISPRQLQVREYFLRVIPTRTFTCKVSPSTQITYHPDPKLFTLDDGFQEPITLMSIHRNILGATFHGFMLKNIGGSEKFKDKQTFFYNKLREHIKRPNRSEKRLCVSRFNLVETARHATKSFSSTDWCKKFSIEFEGEEGLDWGGLSREFFELMSVELFDASNKLFMRFNEEDHQALVHPNHSSLRPSRWKLKHFLFAGKIVGKCLYESAMGNPLLVKARFTRSFLAQLIGLRINYKYFETDDPSLYTSKVQYILENDVTDLGLVFAEEEFEAHGGAPTVIPLLDNGEDLDVTEMNKTRYLNILSQYRFTKRVGEEIDQFLKGLNEIVPDNLLSIFDENELELLMCGMGTVSFEDLKEHSVVSGTSIGFQQVLSWFWAVNSSFTQEEMAKLLQFVTGCSQLPPGGFKELNPKFTITSAPTRGRLPTSHTCFNQICLPEYDSCEQFHTSLMTALNEGAEGFGML